jgi:Xaa-Pro aminopeptidase
MSATTNETTTRADRLLEVLGERDLHALLVTDLTNVRWLTGFTGSSGAAVLGVDGTRRFVTDFRYLTQSAEQLDDTWAREISTDIIEGVVKQLPGEGELRLGFDDANLSVRDHAKLGRLVRDGIELVPAGGAIEGLRVVKDAEELDRVRAAAKLADEALAEVLTRGLAGRTERDVALDLEFTMRRMGAEAVSFPPIVAAGPHGALPHAQPRDVAIGPGELVVVDWGAELDGYCSDCTRTLATGDVDDATRTAYELVLDAQLQGVAAVHAGVGGREADSAARAVIDAAGHGENFGHGLGHGVGMEVHEAPNLSPRSKDTLVAGNVVTVEPGVYLSGKLGVRIEDLVFVTDDGGDVFTSLSKELTVVD